MHFLSYLRWAEQSKTYRNACLELTNNNSTTSNFEAFLPESCLCSFYCRFRISTFIYTKTWFRVIILLLASWELAHPCIHGRIA